jgi:isoleucyl-tRNA synthetase
MEMMERYGADAVRWYMYTVTQPGDAKRFDEQVLDEMVKKVFMILWNVKEFYQLYKNGGERFSVSGGEVRSGTQNTMQILDRWILGRLQELIQKNTAWLEAYKITEPTRAIGEFVQDLSTWYIRRSRERVKGGGEEAARAVATLQEVLLTLAKLLAPFTPFFAEALYQDVGKGALSVHLEDWPKVREECLDENLLLAMERVRQIVSLGLEAREKAKVNVRQPLSCVTVYGAKTLPTDLANVLKDELNVKEVLFFGTIGDRPSELKLDTVLTPSLLREGLVRELVRQVNVLRKEAGLTIEDQISLALFAEDVERLEAAVEEHRATLLRGTFASSVEISPFTAREESTPLRMIQGMSFAFSIHKN